ncbi:MAG: prolipoprotein diacylglyceryl transferase [Candidatus Latescibacteria bacterium]|nr:prolipoprotein diacylglyceryl transferase [Candidatus Latescibacterota bacterium]
MPCWPWPSWRNRTPLVPVLDASAPALAIGYAIGRIGCQLAGDGDYGVPTELPWGMAYPNGVVPTLEKVHPTPVYETLGGLLLFGILWKMPRSMQRPGLAFCLYLVWAGSARFLVEFIRLNPRVLWGLTAAQLISLGLIGIGGIWGSWLLMRSAPDAEYELAKRTVKG